jgi:hypothetical protein
MLCQQIEEVIWLARLSTIGMQYVERRLLVYVRANLCSARSPRQAQ